MDGLLVRAASQLGGRLISVDGMNRFAAFAGLLLLFLACTSPIKDEAESVELYLHGVQETIEIDSGSNVIPISFSTNRSWTAHSDASWISLSSSKGSAGDAAIVATVEENRTEATRTGKVTITAGSASQSIRIAQSSVNIPSANEMLVLTARITDYTTFTVSVTTNATRSYFFDVVEKSVWDKDGGEAVWKRCFRKDAVLDKNGSKEYTNQKAMTEYLAFAAFCDANGVRTGDFYTEVFLTDTGLGSNDPSPITLSVSSMTATSFVLNTSSHSTEKYYFDIVEKENWDTSGGDAVWQASVKSRLEAGTFVSKLVSGEAFCKFERLRTTKYVAFAAYCYNDGKLKSTIFIKEIDLANASQDTAPTYLSINTNLALLPGETRMLTANCYDEDFHIIETAKATWTSSNPSVATINQEGVVKALKVGRTTITAKAVKGSASDNALVYVASDFNQPVDLGLSVKWAQLNIGAKRPENAGGYYRWGETETYASTYSVNYPYRGFSFWSSHRDEVLDGNDNLYRSMDPANHLVGKQWRMPTKAEFEELLNKCSCDWVKLNGMRGCLFTSKSSGSTDKFLFFPRVGGWWASRYYEDETDSDGTDYWSSSFDYFGFTTSGPFVYEENAFALQLAGNFTSNRPIIEEGCWAYGNPVRPVFSDELYLDLIVSNIKSDQCTVTAGTNSSDTYYLYFVNKTLWDEYGEDLVWQAIVKLETDADSFVKKLQTGDQVFDIINLSAQTEYVVFAAFCNQNGSRKGIIYHKNFKTQ